MRERHKAAGNGVVKKAGRAGSVEPYSHPGVRSTLMLLGAIVLLALLLLEPLVTLLLPHLLETFSFLAFVRYPFTDYSRPNDHGVLGEADNHYVDGIGVWTVKTIRRSRGHDPARILYLHGNIGTRASPHRVDLYNYITLVGFNGAAVDYRGFADTPGTPSEEGVIEDAIRVYDWLKARYPEENIILYGHSLGAAIASGVARKLCKRGDCPTGLILSSPFSDLFQGMLNYPIGRFFAYYPHFMERMRNAYGKIEARFNNTDNVRALHMPMFIFWSEDDMLIPASDSRLVYTAAVQSRTADDLPIFQTEYAAAMGFGHRITHRAPDLADNLRDFTIAAQDFWSRQKLKT